LPIIVYGLMTDHEGRPIAVDVYRGNTGDPSTVVDQVNKLRERGFCKAGDAENRLGDFVGKR
jgi:transposase